MSREEAVRLLDDISGKLVVLDWESSPENLSEVEQGISKLRGELSFSSSLEYLAGKVSEVISSFKEGKLPADALRSFLTDALDAMSVSLSSGYSEEEIKTEVDRVLSKYGFSSEKVADSSGGSSPGKRGVPEVSEEDIDIVKDFLEESYDHVSEIEEKILNLESEPDNVDLINEIFRPFHSMKGAAGFLNFTDINRFCHEVETLLDKARKGEYRITESTVNVLLESVDVIKALLANVRLALSKVEGKSVDESQFIDVDIEPTISKIHALLSGEEPSSPSEEKKEEEEGEETEEILEEGKIGKILVDEGIVTPKDVKEALEEQQKSLGEILVEKGKVSPDDIEKALKKQEKMGGPSTIKVSSKKLDLLMEMVGELVIAFSIIERHPALSRDEDLDISKKISNLGKIVDSLQDHVLSLRMIPLKQTFQKMNRLVRDVSRKTGKKARLVVKGEDTEVDKTVAEEIYDPLVHLLRNSVDHGIEPPEERKRLGKPEVGTVVLSAYHWAGRVVIEVSDDGAGLNREKILKKAIERGIVEPGKDLTDKEVYELIFSPGFSTAEKASDISGRGVGLDVVKKNVTKLGGSIEVSSTPGKGATFTIRLPLTTAIVDGMIVRIGDQRFVIPTASIREAIRLSPENYSTAKEKGEMIRLRGKLIPLVRLYELFGIVPEHEDPFQALAIIVESKDGRVSGMLVDDLIGQQRVVIKPLGDLFKGIRGISGGSILGDGRVGLILDVDGLISMS